tara:strand:- start:3075 stop:3356 length:282 start_codon:yes stop_codon:yes gene_type:complete
MANGIHKYTVAESNNLQIGQGGFDLIAQGSSDGNSGQWVAIYNPDAAAIVIDTTSPVGDSLTNFSLLSGHTIYGNFTSVTVDTVGKSAICYRG